MGWVIIGFRRKKQQQKDKEVDLCVEMMIGRRWARLDPIGLIFQRQAGVLLERVGYH